MTQTHFYPVFAIERNERGIQLLYPNLKTIEVTGEAPEGFDGALIYRRPPVYPFIAINDSWGRFQRIPNRLVRDPDEWRIYCAEFEARRTWTRTPNDGSPESIKRAIEADAAKRSENKRRGDAARQDSK